MSEKDFFKLRNILAVLIACHSKLLCGFWAFLVWFRLQRSMCISESIYTVFIS